MASRESNLSDLYAGRLAISRAEYQRATGLSLQTINRLIARGKLDAVQFDENSRVLIPVYELERFLRSEPKPAVPQADGLLTRSAPMPLTDEDE